MLFSRIFNNYRTLLLVNFTIDLVITQKQVIQLIMTPLFFVSLGSLYKGLQLEFSALILFSPAPDQARLRGCFLLFLDPIIID